MKLFTDLFHFHKWTTLIIFPPHSHQCKQPQCATNNMYGFLLHCECGKTKYAKLPYTITEIFDIGGPK